MFFTIRKGRFMPVAIKRCDTPSLHDLTVLREKGYSVLKSPHVGNQHPSNLVCAALKIPMEMVSFTRGDKDKNFHPHCLIKAGCATSLYDASVWTPFARLPSGQSAAQFHQEAVRSVFKATDICTDMERMRQESELTTVVLRETNHAIPMLWYRQVAPCGRVDSVKNVTYLPDIELETQVFQFSNDTAGWIVPNRVHILFDLVWQCLSSGRAEIFHLSGPQMAGYIGGITKSLSVGYDAIRAAIPELPKELICNIVPVAGCRYVTHASKSAGLEDIVRVILWYESLPHEQRAKAMATLADVAGEYSDLFVSIEEGRFLSQYDLANSSDLVLSDWMLTTPLKRVNVHTERFVKLLRKAAA